MFEPTTGAFFFGNASVDHFIRQEMGGTLTTIKFFGDDAYQLRHNSLMFPDNFVEQLWEPHITISRQVVIYRRKINI